MSVISEVGHNLVVMMITVIIMFFVIIGIFLLIFWFLNSKVNIIGLSLKDILIR